MVSHGMWAGHGLRSGALGSCGIPGGALPAARARCPTLKGDEDRVSQHPPLTVSTLKPDLMDPKMEPEQKLSDDILCKKRLDFP